MMRPFSGLQTCDCCRELSKQEFSKIVEIEDAGLVIYRYSPQDQDEVQIGTDTADVFILQNTGTDVMDIKKVTTESGMSGTSCPRCKKMIERARFLLRSLAPEKVRAVTGICDHCYKKELFPCPCCDKIIEKFRNFYKDEVHKTKENILRNTSWIIKTHESFRKTFSNIKDGKTEPRKIIGLEADKRKFVSGSEIIHVQATASLEQELEDNFDILSFLDFSREDKQGVKFEEKSEEEKLKETKKLQADKTAPEAIKWADEVAQILTKGVDEIAHKPEKVVSFHAAPKTIIDKDIIIKPTSALKKKEDIKPKPKMEREKDTTQLVIKRKSIIKKQKKDEDGSTPAGVMHPGKKQHPKEQLSLETVLKSKSEPKVSTFSFAFAGEKKKVKKQPKSEVSSTVLIKDTRDMLQEKAEVKRKEKEELEKLAEQKKQQNEEGANAISALKEQLAIQAKDLLEEEKIKKQQDIEIGEKKAREAEQLQRQEQDQKKGDGNKIQKKDREKIKEREDKQLHGAAKQAKQQSEGKNRKQEEEKAAALGEKKAQEAGKALKATQQEQATEHSAATAAREKKIKPADLKQTGEKAAALGEKKAQEAGKALKATQQQQATENSAAAAAAREKKIKPADLKQTGEITQKEEKVKEPQIKTDGALAALIKERELQKQRALEAEKKRKEQEREKELAEKKIKELESKMKEAKAFAIKKPVIEVEEQESTGEEVDQDILKPIKPNEVIIGQKILKVKSGKESQEEGEPILESKGYQAPKQYASKINDDQKPGSLIQSKLTSKPLTEIAASKAGTHTTPPGQKVASTTEDNKTKGAVEGSKSKAAPEGSKSKPAESEVQNTIIRYTLSDRTFIDKGWTMLPTEKVVRKVNVYRMRPSQPQYDWFEHNKDKTSINYSDSGQKFADLTGNGRGRWYYRSGELAMDYYDAEEGNAGQRFVIYSTVQPDERGRSRPRTLLATFDYNGNGVVFDHAGKIRLKYNQTEGVVLDRTIGPVSHWKWHSLNDPPDLQQVMIDTHMPYKDPNIVALGDKNADAKRPDHDEMLAIEYENFLKEKRQKLTQSFKPFQIRMKALKINDQFSLRVLDQRSIYLLFRDGSTGIKINIGMILDNTEIIDTDTSEIGEVSNALDKLPAVTDSLAELQQAVAKAQAQERLRVRHELRVKRPEPTASVDALRAGCSRPLRPALVQAPLSSCEKMTPKRFKPTCCNLYYSTQLL